MTVRDQKLEAARKLATSHVATDELVDEVFLLESDSDEDQEQPIRLLEIVEGTIKRGIEPIGFPAMQERGVPFGSVIVEVSPREFSHLRDEPFVTFRSERWTIGPKLASR